jgi:hypothetical protein
MIGINGRRWWLQAWATPTAVKCHVHLPHHLRRRGILQQAIPPPLLQRQICTVDSTRTLRRLHTRLEAEGQGVDLANRVNGDGVAVHIWLVVEIVCAVKDFVGNVCGGFG